MGIVATSSIVGDLLVRALHGHEAAMKPEQVRELGVLPNLLGMKRIPLGAVASSRLKRSVLLEELDDLADIL